MNAVTDLREVPSEISERVPFPDGRGPRPAQLRRPSFWTARRAGKIVIALVVVLLGTYAAFYERGFVSTRDAVVTAYVVSLRSPISGTVSHADAAVGEAVSRGALLASLVDERADEQRLSDLRSLALRYHADRLAIETERDSLNAIADSLARRAAMHTAAMRGSAALHEEEAAGLAAARAARAMQARSELARRAQLGPSGFVSAAEIDHLRAASEIAQGEAAAANANFAALRLQEEAAAGGMVLSDTSNDVAYSVQRADEVALRRVEVERALASAAAAESETEARLVEEERRHALMRAATLIAPSAGMVWKRGASNGERLGAGDTGVELVDCGASFVLAAIPQDRVPDVVARGSARVRVSGERTDRDGVILSVSGDEKIAGDRNLAVVPLPAHSGMATVRVAIAPSPNRAGECLVGRTARVLLPLQSGALRNLFPTLL
jgi:multidrug resistance efflux pump